ncbi:helix-turn-helix domain-containing protein [Paenibacillus sp.]|uniref:helix-turn-helix domain-containing protein n=1 Tax=Paenibacillus sp. TaxID=58172 RepID=UPI002D5EF3DA|nr:helix-turn-helix domain-containing protein [Paenibacillus sp.]HZG86283.1 helix-turn-helix domain-containing protein [Paenibacillus sp.]
MKVNNYVKRMLLSYLPILFVTLGLFIFIFFAIMNQLNVRNAIQANRMTAEFVANMMDSSLKGISFDAQRMIETGGMVQQYLDGPSDRVRDFDVSNMLSSLMVRHGLIESVYLYRADDGRVMDQSAIRPLGQFPDRNYVRIALKQPYTGVWSPPRMKQSESQGEPRSLRVTSLGFKIPRDSGSLGYLVINVKVSSLESFLDQMIDRSITEAQLYDAAGEPFFADGRRTTFVDRLSAEIVSDYTGWTYRISIKGGKLFDFLSYGSTVWVLLGLGGIGFAIGSTFYVTKRNYKPIESILHRIERFSSAIKPADPKENKNEFAFIDHAIERLITNNMAFQEQQQEHLVIRRQQYLQMLLKGECDDDRAAWEQEWLYYGLAEGRCIVALLEIDNYVRFGLKYSPNDQSLFKFIVSSVAVEVGEQTHSRIVAEWISKHQLVLLLISGERELEHRSLQLAEQIRAWVEDHLDFTVTIGIGPPANDEADIHRSFEEASEAVSRKVSLGSNQIIDAVELKDKPAGEWFAYLEGIRSIVRKLRMSEPDWLDDAKRLFGDMAVHRLRKDDVDRLLHYLIFHLEYELEGTMQEAVKFWLAEAKPRLLAATEQADTLRELEDDMLAAMRRLFEQIEELAQSRRHHVLMREIRDYVAEHFMDPNLSLTLLSERFQIGPKYLSQLFKDSIGQNFSDFLIGLRIDYAKKLLRESDATVQDISDMMGYSNPTSFIRVFKKIVGVSPGQYRETQTKPADSIQA